MITHGCFALKNNEHFPSSSSYTTTTRVEQYNWKRNWEFFWPAAGRVTKGSLAGSPSSFEVQQLQSIELELNVDHL